jgi:hypothetical protein
MPHTLPLQNDLFKWFLDCARARSRAPRGVAARTKISYSPKVPIFTVLVPRQLGHRHNTCTRETRRNRKEDIDD